MKVHELKTWAPEFWAVSRHEKRVEVRFDDRDFKVGDLLLLKMHAPSAHDYEAYALMMGEHRSYADYITAEYEENPAELAHEGRGYAETMIAQVRYITRGRFLAMGYVALSIALVDLVEELPDVEPDRTTL